MKKSYKADTITGSNGKTSEQWAIAVLLTALERYSGLKDNFGRITSDSTLALVKMNLG